MNLPEGIPSVERVSKELWSLRRHVSEQQAQLNGQTTEIAELKKTCSALAFHFGHLQNLQRENEDATAAISISPICQCMFSAARHGVCILFAIPSEAIIGCSPMETSGCSKTRRRAMNERLPDPNRRFASRDRIGAFLRELLGVCVAQCIAQCIAQFTSQRKGSFQNPGFTYEILLHELD